jgi:hypothetical protein
MPRSKSKQKKSAASPSVKTDGDDILDSFAPPPEVLSPKKPQVIRSKSYKKRSSSNAAKNRSSNEDVSANVEQAGEVVTNEFSVTADDLKSIDISDEVEPSQKRTPEYIGSDTAKDSLSELKNAVISVDQSFQQVESVMPQTIESYEKPVERYYDSASEDAQSQPPSEPPSRPDSEAAFTMKGTHIVVQQRGMAEEDDGRDTLVFEQTAPRTELEKAIVNAVYADPDEATVHSHHSVAVASVGAAAAAPEVAASAPKSAHQHRRTHSAEIKRGPSPAGFKGEPEREPLLNNKDAGKAKADKPPVDPNAKRRERKFCCC